MNPVFSEMSKSLSRNTTLAEDPPFVVGFCCSVDILDTAVSGDGGSIVFTLYSASSRGVGAAFAIDLYRTHPPTAHALVTPILA